MQTKQLNNLHPIIGNYYYFNKCIKKFKCLKINTGVTGEQSNFIDYKKVLHQFYNPDMYLNKQLKQ